jgi:hypothetical protein
VNRREIEAGIALLLEEVAQEPEDEHELYLRLLNLLNGMRSLGMSVPQDLLALEEALEAKFGEGSPIPEQPA